MECICKGTGFIYSDITNTKLYCQSCNYWDEFCRADTEPCPPPDAIEDSERPTEPYTEQGEENEPPTIRNFKNSVDTIPRMNTLSVDEQGNPYRVT